MQLDCTTCVNHAVISIVALVLAWSGVHWQLDTAPRSSMHTSLFFEEFGCSSCFLCVLLSPGFSSKNFDDQSPGQGRLEVHGGQDKRSQGDPPQGEEVNSSSGEARDVSSSRILLSCFRLSAGCRFIGADVENLARHETRGVCCGMDRFRGACYTRLYSRWSTCGLECS